MTRISAPNLLALNGFTDDFALANDLIAGFTYDG